MANKETKDNTLQRTTLILGLIALFFQFLSGCNLLAFIFAPLAIIIGFMSISNKQRGDNYLEGIIGIILGFIVIILLLAGLMINKFPLIDFRDSIIFYIFAASIFFIIIDLLKSGRASVKKDTNERYVYSTKSKEDEKAEAKPVEENEPVPSKKQKIKNNRKLASNILICFGVGVFLLVLTWASLDFLSSNKETNPTYTKPEAIKIVVEELREYYNLPTKIDNFTTMVEVTSQPNAIRHHYILSGIDPDSLSNDSIKESLLPVVCADKIIRNNVLGKGINLEHSYMLEGDSRTYFVTITKADCL